MTRRPLELVTGIGGEETAAAELDTCGHALIRVTSRRSTEFMDITDRVARLVCASGISLGIVNVQSLHTTTGVVVNEHEPLLLEDFEATLLRTVPGDAVYGHDDRTLRSVNLVEDERANGHAHCRALFLPSSASVNIVDGKLLLGRWQRLFLVELDGPRRRTVSVMVVGDGARRR
jgi:secondary thiamine-phosphate synthase enzyme